MKRHVRRLSLEAALLSVAFVIALIVSLKTIMDAFAGRKNHLEDKHYRDALKRREVL